MAEEVVASSWFSVLYEKYFSYLPPEGSLALGVFLFAVGLAVAAIFIWYFYKSTSKRNLIQLNLYQYNRSEHPLMSKFIATVLYLLEYIVIMPLLIILWFAGLSFVLLFIAKERTLVDILMISAAMIAAIRILAYYKAEISKDLAKLFPFITLSVFLLTPGEFNFDVVLNHLRSIPDSLSTIIYVVLVVVVLEVVMRIAYTMVEFWKSEDQVAKRGVVDEPPSDDEDDED